MEVGRGGCEEAVGGGGVEVWCVVGWRCVVVEGAALGVLGFRRVERVGALGLRCRDGEMVVCRGVALCI